MRLEQRHRELLEAIEELDEPVNGRDLAEHVGEPYNGVKTALRFMRRHDIVEYEEDGVQYLYHGRADG